jgi:hypothetical protein
MGALIVKKRREQEKKEVKDSRKTIEARRLADAQLRAKDSKPVKDADEEDEEEVAEVLADLSKEDIEALKELLPYKEALIKIAKGEFEIERIIEEDDEDDNEDEVIEEDDTTEEITEEDEVEVDENLNEEDAFEDTIEDSKVGAMDDDEAINEAWRERLNGKK